MRRTSTQRATELSSDSIAAFRLWLGFQGMAENTSKAYCSDLNLFLLDSGMDTIPEEEYEEMAMAWLMMKRTGKHREAPKTSSRRLTSLRKFAVVMFGESVLADYRGPTTSAGAPHPIPEGIDGVERMIAEAKKQEHVALLTLCGLQGCRIQEALDITPKSFNLDAMTLTIRGKGDKTRHIPVSDKSWGYLAVPTAAAMLAGTTLVTAHERYARKLITVLGERAGLQRRVASHDLRATFATSIWNLTGDGLLVQRLLGHANFSTTQGYIETEWNKMRDALNRL